MSDEERLLQVDLSEVQIDEVKFKSETTRVDFRARTPNGSEELRVDSHIELPEELIEARVHLQRHLLDLCEIPRDEDHEVEITGVAFKWEDGVMGAVVKGKRSFLYSMGTLALNTPVHYEDHDHAEREFEPEQAEALRAFHEACISFVEKVGGPPDQQDLFDEAAQENGVEPEPVEA